MESPTLSVIIPARNESKFVGGCLESILASDYPAGRLEILVIDGESTDDTADVAGRYAPRVRVLRNPHRTTACALNIGLAAAGGEVIARVDAHSRISPGFLSGCVRNLLASGAWNAGGAMRTRASGSSPWAPAIVAATTHPFGVGNSAFRTGTAGVRWVDTVFGGCWPRTVFERLGGFNEKLARGQDFEFNQRIRRAGGKILLDSALETEYYTRADLRSFCRHNWTNGIWAVLPWALAEGVPVSWRHLVPMVFTGTFGISILAAVAGVRAWTTVGLIGGVYAAAALGATVHIARRERQWNLLLRMPAAFLCLHFPYGAGSLWGALLAAAALWRRMKAGPAISHESSSTT